MDEVNKGHTTLLSIDFEDPKYLQSVNWKLYEKGCEVSMHEYSVGIF